MKKAFLTVISIVLMLCMTVLSASALNKAKEDFEGAAPGTDPLMLDTVFDYFEYITATPDSAVEIVNEDFGNMLKITGFSDFRTMGYIEGEYVFSVDVYTPEADPGRRCNIFVRGEVPGALSKLNPPNANSMNVFNYYEWDWYNENGGADGKSEIGGTGVFVNLGDLDIKLVVKKYAEDGLTVASDVALLDYPESMADEDMPLEKPVNVKYTDDGKEIKVYINNNLLARIALSEDSVSYDSDETGNLYYKSAVAYDANGSELFTTENTRIRYENSQIAMATRAGTMYVDNISFTIGTGAIAASEGGEEPVTEAPTEKATEAPQTEAPTEKVTEAPQTEAPQTEAHQTEEQKTEAAKPETKAEDKTDPVKEPEKKNNTTLIIVIIAAIVIVAALVVIFIPKKKK